MKKILPIVLIALAATLSGCALPGQKPVPVACTMEAKICPDGSSVGRQGPNCEFTACPATSTTQIANPASVNCKDKSGNSVIKTKPDGSQYGLCYFDDNRACEEWAMMRGDCPVGGVKTTGFDTDAQKFCAWSGGTTYAVENAVCTFKDGSFCLDDALFTGVCAKGSQTGLIAIIKQLFVDKYKKSASEVSVTISQMDATHVRGGVLFGAGGAGEGGNYLAAQVNGQWKIVFDGNGGISCKSLNPYGFPAGMMFDCYNN